MRNIGDRVKIKTWEQLLEEYGPEDSGFIPGVSGGFTPQMRDYCGATLTIKRVDYFYSVAEDGGKWNWSEEMFDETFDLMPDWGEMPKEYRCEHPFDKIKRELEEEGYINNTPGMYVTYQGPKMGEILRASLTKRDY